jgi:hypothetical protein
MTLSYDAKIARQVDATMRELIVLLSRQSVRLTPATIEAMRQYLVIALLEAGRLRVANDNAERAKAPFDDEPTDPQRPSRRPKM